MNRLQAFVKEKQRELVRERQQQLLQQIVSNDRNLSEVELSGAVDDGYCEEVLDGLHENCFLTKLKAVNRDMNGLASAVAAMLNKNQNLVVLRLSNCSLQDDAVTTILGGLIKNTSIVSLMLDNNRITSGKSVALLMTHNSSVENIDLTNNRLGIHGDAEFLCIADALPAARGLKSLHLGGNGISDTAARHYASVIERTIEDGVGSTPIQILDLGEESSVRIETKRTLTQLLAVKKRPGLGQGNLSPPPSFRDPSSKAMEVHVGTASLDTMTDLTMMEIELILASHSQAECSSDATGTVAGSCDGTETEGETSNGVDVEAEKRAAVAAALVNRTEELRRSNAQNEKLSAQVAALLTDKEILAEHMVETKKENAELKAKMAQMEEQMRLMQLASEEALSKAGTSEKKALEAQRDVTELVALQEAEMQKVAEQTTALQTRLAQVSELLTAASGERDAALTRLSAAEDVISSMEKERADSTDAVQHLLKDFATSSTAGGVSEGQLHFRPTREVAVLTDVTPREEQKKLQKKQSRRQSTPDPVPPSSNSDLQGRGTDSSFAGSPSVSAPPVASPQDNASDNGWCDAGADHGDLLSSQAMTKDRWVPDGTVQWCMSGCRTKFSLTVRKHHCRRCGRVFCDKCCPKSNLHQGKRLCVLCLQ
jgi:hypothetical protein